MDNIEFQPSGGEDGATFACSVCGRKFENRQGVASHLRHFHSSDAVWQCSTCLVSFRTEGERMEHQHEHRAAKVRRTASHNVRDSPSPLPDARNVVVVGLDDLVNDSSNEQVDFVLPDSDAPSFNVALISDESFEEQVARAIGDRTLEAVRERGDNAITFSEFLATTSGMSAADLVKILALLDHSGGNHAFPSVDQYQKMHDETTGLLHYFTLTEDGTVGCWMIPPTAVYARLMAYKELIIQQPITLVNNEGGVGVYKAYVTAEHFHEICAAPRAPSTLLSLAVYSDSTTLSRKGQRSMHAMYLELLNGAESFPEREKRFLVGFVPSFSKRELKKAGIPTTKHSEFRASVFHLVLRFLARLGGMTIHDPDGIHVVPHGSSTFENVYAVLAAHKGDRPEQNLVAGKFGSQSWRLKRFCRACNTPGDCMHHDFEEIPALAVQNLDAAIDEAIAILGDPQWGDVGAVASWQREHSVLLVKNGYRECRMWNNAQGTPRCEMHTLVIVLETLLLKWTLAYTLEHGGVNAVVAINERVELIDPGLGEVYDPTKETLNPNIFTAQHRHRALRAVTLGVRGVLNRRFADDELVAILVKWERLYTLARQDALSENELRSLDILVAEFRRESREMFRKYTASDFRFPTMHELIHLTQDVRRYGALSVMSTKLGEHDHIDNVKEPFQSASNHTKNQENLALQLLNVCVQRRILAPLTLVEPHQAPRNHRIGFGSREKSVAMSDLIRSQLRVRGNRIDWNHLGGSWCEFAKLKDVNSVRITPFKWWCASQSGVKAIANASYYQRPRYDVLCLRGVPEKKRFVRLLLCFEADERSRASTMGGTEFMWVQQLERPKMCPVYQRMRVYENDSFLIIRPSKVVSVWNPIWIAPHTNSLSELYLVEDK